MVQARHVSHNFGTHWALKNVSFSLNKGEFLFLSGPSGAGKTTLLRLLYASLPLVRGQAEVAGFQLKDLSGRHVVQLRRQVSVVFQDFKILKDRTVAANVALPLEVRGMPARIATKRVNAVLRSLGLEKKALCRCSELSGGEQQRVAIARAIVINPQLLLADEPTGNLDRDLAMHLMEVFKQFHTFGTTVILATHNRDVVESVPGAKRLELVDGHVTNANWQAPDLEIAQTSELPNSRPGCGPDSHKGGRQ
ncbi:cell division ATP-binding protein FtsE [Desulfovibrio ferrophilus]|uniref:Cell division ATP-binding protein FtsE n=1 Tax=Desulfovibrio ferrophilus TaxID=241368 RepID=A0A2Z6B1K1_9BACT|nr:cell division ATP-binding protein FtsE [Desulfovibrio ferrophilus]BBD09364.1 cell division ATP-binding protein FtsE [Desulfovibrio ferrophilus]